MDVDERTYLGEADDFMTVRHLTIRGTNREIGQTLAETVMRRYGTSPADLRGDPPIVRAQRDYLRRVYPVHWQRACGVASAFGIDPDDDRYDPAALSYNMGLPLPAMGCSVVYYPPATTATGGGLLSRNYDFPTTSVAQIMGIPTPPDVLARLPAAMSEPYVMQWYPSDGGYASLAVHAFDPLAGTLDGINSAGLVVSILADEEALATLGPLLEPHFGARGAVGLHELQVMRWLLDTCDSADQARQALLAVKQYYFMVPCHYIVADRTGDSFVYENSTGRNIQHVIDGGGRPQIVTNFQLYRHPDLSAMPDGPPTPQTQAFWRYRILAGRIAAHRGPFTAESAAQANACVNIQRVLEAAAPGPGGSGIAATMTARTLWHTIYDQHTLTAQTSFYLGETTAEDGTRTERRSPYLHFTLSAT